MSKVDVNLSASGRDEAIFYNLDYKADHQGGNHTETTFQIDNWSGNGIEIEVATYQTDRRTQTTKLVWHPVSPRGFDGVKIQFRGSCENNEFLRMLQLILEAERIVGIIKP